MKGDCGKVKRFFSILWSTVKFLFVVLLVYLGSLFFREEKLPRACVQAICRRLSTDTLRIRCDSASFGFRKGVQLHALKVEDRRPDDGWREIASVRRAAIDPILRRVRLVELKYPRLPDSYYAPGSQETNARLELELPKIPEFRLQLDNPAILGLTPARVTAQVCVHPRWVTVDEAHIDWPENGRTLQIDGHVRLDLLEQWFRAEVSGLATQRQIRPLLEALDVPCAFPYFDAFTDIPQPVPARGRFEANLVNGDFFMNLDLKPVMGRYNGVEMARADGVLDFRYYVRGTNGNMRLTVDLPVALDPEGGRLGGSLTVDMTNDVVRLDYDIGSELAFRDILRIADVSFLSPDDTLDMIRCDTKPVITVKGRTGTTEDDLEANDLACAAQLAKGAFYGMELRDVDAVFNLRRDRLDFTRVTARGKTGGRIDARATLDFAGFDPARATAHVETDYREGSLEELADGLDFDLGERRGRVDASYVMDFPMTTNCVRGLNGTGRVKVTDGMLAQMKLFAGLTKLIAEKVPGVGFLVNQSQASADFTIENGVFTSDNVRIEGGFISIKGWGAYDIADDNLDFTVRVQFLKSDSMMGQIIQPITWPFTKLLLEFRAKGPLDSPDWEYVSVIDRIL